jgi:hypothetical protein
LFVRDFLQHFLFKVTAQSKPLYFSFAADAIAQARAPSMLPPLVQQLAIVELGSA